MNMSAKYRSKFEAGIVSRWVKHFRMGRKTLKKTKNTVSDGYQFFTKYFGQQIYVIA